MLDESRQRWAVGMIEEKMGPEGAAALGVVLRDLHREIQESTETRIKKDTTEFNRSLQGLRADLNRMTLIVAIPLAMALLGLLVKLFIPGL